MGLLGTLIEVNKVHFLDKQELADKNHRLTITSIARKNGNFGEQWMIGLRVETEISEDGAITEGFISFPTATKSRNNILEGLAEHIAENGPYKDVCLKGKVLTEATKLKAATVFYWLDEWTEEDLDVLEV